MFSAVDKDLFFTKNDTNDIRLGDIVKSSETFSNSIVEDNFSNQYALVGYPDDEGIKLNGGRIGASLAPDSIRKILYKMTPPYQNDLYPKITDYGNLPNLTSLNERHDLALSFVNQLIEQNKKIISFGGGHDYGYADGSAFLEKYIGQASNKPLIINFDAHLDVRPNTTSNHSGTPFYRLKEKYNDQFNLLEIGLQPHCNSKNHWDWAKNKNIELIDLESVDSTNWKVVFENNFVSCLTKTTPVFVSFDIDCLCIADAGGCSQAWPTGLKINDCLQFLKKLYSISNTVGLGIYEVSPPLDMDSKTSKAASLLAYQFIFS